MPSDSSPPTVATTNYRKFQTGNPLVRRLIERFFGKVTAMYDSLSPSSLLDAGCGEGETLARLGKRLPPLVAGIDILPDSVRLAQQRTAGAWISTQSIYSTAFAERSFDVVMCLEVLEHLEHPAQAIRELARVSRENLLLSVPFEPYFQLGSLMRGKYLRHFGNHPEHINHWNPRSFERFLAPLVDVVRVETSFPWILAHCRTPRTEPAR